ncbi:MAG: hypothetical protein HY314_11030 [Acidobacteria bacterium]|nr:hypothetical protein [Acidobacteriota bacterium]
MLFDRLESAGKHHYSQLFHPPFADDLEVDDLFAWVRKEKAQLYMRFLAPDGIRLSKRPGHIPIREILRLPSVKLKDRAYLEATTPEAAEKAAFLVLLFPQRRSDTSLPAVQKIEGQGLLGLRLQLGDSLDRVGFALQDGIPLRDENISTDGRSFRVSQTQGQIRVVSLEEATYLEAGGRIWLRSDKPISGVGAVEGGQIEWHMLSSAPSTLEFHTEFRPTEIRLDGRRLAPQDYSFQWEQRSMKLVLPEGTHTISARP